MTDSAQPLDFGESEVSMLGLELMEFEGFEMPRLKDSRIAYGCSCHQLLSIGPSRQPLVVCQIHRMFLDDEILRSGTEDFLQVDVKKLDPIARLGGEEYATVGDVLTVPGQQH